MGRTAIRCLVKFGCSKKITSVQPKTGDSHLFLKRLKENKQIHHPRCPIIFPGVINLSF